MSEREFFVTCTPERAGAHLVHAADCPVRPDRQMERLGAFEDGAAALEAARGRHAPLAACPRCCGEDVPAEVSIADARR